MFALVLGRVSTAWVFSGALSVASAAGGVPIFCQSIFGGVFSGLGRWRRPRFLSVDIRGRFQWLGPLEASPFFVS